jgi:putative transcriptional regulator
MKSTSDPIHHVPEESLLEYVAGTTTEPVALAIACHVALCPACAVRAAALEEVGGRLLDQNAGQELAPGALEAVLARIDGAPQSKEEARLVPAAPPFLAEYGLPVPLLRSLGGPSPAEDWRFVVPGVRAVDLPVAQEADTTVRLISFKAGLTIPLHDHGGPEHIVVFHGALEETGKRFGRGDISIRAPGERHEQHAAAGQPCIALAVNEGKLEPLTLRGRILLALAR